MRVDGSAAGRTGEPLDVSACGTRVEAGSGGSTAKAALKLARGGDVKLTLRARAMLEIPGGTVTVNDLGTKKVASFLLDQTEVTVAAFEQCVNSAACSKPDTGSNCNWGISGKGKHPINCVDWSQAKAYCDWAETRLPSEEEWQLAAESSRGLRFPWGYEDPSSERVCFDRRHAFKADEGTCEVGTHGLGDNAQGVKDLSGNVSEWTDSCGGAGCSVRVFRGGSWDDGHAKSARAEMRFSRDPSYRIHDLGFRCSRSN